MSFAQAFVLQTLLGGDDDNTEDGTVATEALSHLSDETPSQQQPPEIIRQEEEEEDRDVTAPPPVHTADHVRSDNSLTLLSEVESISDASTSASTSVASSSSTEEEHRNIEDTTTVSSMSIDDLSSLTTTTSLDELDTVTSNDIRSTSEASNSVTDGVNDGQRWTRLGWPIRLRDRVHSPAIQSQSQEDDGGQTILSSQTDTHADESSDLSFQPSMIGSSINAPSSLDSFSSQEASVDPQDVVEQEVTSSPAERPKGPPWPSESTGHDPNTFAAVGSSLLLPPRDPGTSSDNGNPSMDNAWWQNLSEKDWERMAAAAQTVLDSLEEGEEGATLPLLTPPSPPEHTTVSDEFTILDHETRQAIIERLPTEFICPICEDVIVGAVVLGCGCSRSTFCTQCIENDTSSAKPPANSLIDEHDYVIVDKPPPSKCQPVSSTAAQDRPSNKSTNRGTCPSCKRVESLLVPCHALDVAILNSITALSTSSDEALSIAAFQHQYYRRLQSWREEVQSRRKLLGEESDRRRQEMLAMFIQAEEEIIWKKKKKKQRRRRGGFWACRTDGQCKERDGVMFGEVAFLVGAVAIATVIGMKLIRRC